MRFRYQAVNRQGQRVRGVLEADTAQLARQRLREQQLRSWHASGCANSSCSRCSCVYSGQA